MMLFSDELQHIYTRIFRFLQEILSASEYEQIDFLTVTKFIERVMAV